MKSLLFGKKGLISKSAYVLLAETIKEVLFLTIGPSNVNLEEIKPKVTSPLNFFIFPSFISICNTEESRPPNLAGKPPLVSLTVLIASALKTEKRPPK